MPGDEETSPPDSRVILPVGKGVQAGNEQASVTGRTLRRRKDRTRPRGNLLEPASGGRISWNSAGRNKFSEPYR